MRSETDDDVQILPNNLIVQIKMTITGDIIQDVRDSSVESSKPVWERQSIESKKKWEDAKLCKQGSLLYVQEDPEYIPTSLRISEIQSEPWKETLKVRGCTYGFPEFLYVPLPSGR